MRTCACAAVLYVCDVHTYVRSGGLAFPPDGALPGALHSPPLITIIIRGDGENRFNQRVRPPDVINSKGRGGPRRRRRKGADATLSFRVFIISANRRRVAPAWRMGLNLSTYDLYLRFRVFFFRRSRSFRPRRFIIQSLVRGRRTFLFGPCWVSLHIPRRDNASVLRNVNSAAGVTVASGKNRTGAGKEQISR